MDRIDTVYHPIQPIQSRGFPTSVNWQGKVYEVDSNDNRRNTFGHHSSHNHQEQYLHVQNNGQ